VGVDAEAFRAVLGQWPSGVTVVTTVRAEEQSEGDLVAGWHGMTASSFSSVSLDPPLVSVCLARSIPSHDLIDTTGVFAVNILGKDQAHVGKRFAGMMGGEVHERFSGLDFRTAATGSPVLGDALGWVDCRVVYAYPGGDHTIFVGEVLAAETPRLTAPLLFHSRAWGQFADQLPDDAMVLDTGVSDALRGQQVAPGTVSATISALRAAGVATRVLDLSHGPAAGIDRAHLLRADLREGAGAAWARVTRAAQVADLVTAGISGVDVAYGGDTHDVVLAARELGIAVRVEIPAAFAPARIDDTAEAVVKVAALEPDAIVLVDDGIGTPLTVRAVLQETVNRARPVPLAVRLDDRSGTAGANALTALKSGVRRFDATLGGLDHGYALEDALHLFDQLEVAVPADRAAIVRAALGVEAALGTPLPGRTYRLGTSAPTHGGIS
jgi:flavin reductase (DIM6/NTAB) family NADH-FMN oxidoreductase RutF